METKEKILGYLCTYGKENNYRIARALKIDVSKVTEALDALEKEGKIEMKEGRAFLVKKKPIPIVEAKQEEEISNREEVEEEQPQTEVSEELTQESIEEKPTEEEVEQERIKGIKGTVKFYKPNKGFGFIRGDDGKEYRVHESGLKEGFIIKADDRVSFKVFQGHKGPEADDVEAVV